jgi:hypothetical protein
MHLRAFSDLRFTNLRRSIISRTNFALEIVSIGRFIRSIRRPACWIFIFRRKSKWKTRNWPVFVRNSKRRRISKLRTIFGEIGKFIFDHFLCVKQALFLFFFTFIEIEIEIFSFSFRLIVVNGEPKATDGSLA